MHTTICVKGPKHELRQRIKSTYIVSKKTGPLQLI